MAFNEGMAFWDWSIFAALIFGIICILLYCQRYSKNVSDFLSASRCAGRYLLCVADCALAWDVIGAIGVFEMFY